MVSSLEKKTLFRIPSIILDLHQMNRDTYNRVRAWFDQLDAYRRTLITRQLEGYPPCDDLIQDSSKYSFKVV